MKKIAKENQSLEAININDVIVDKLINNSITDTKELCYCNRKKLKNIGLSLDEINHIIIKLQLKGLDISNK